MPTLESCGARPHWRAQSYAFTPPQAIAITERDGRSITYRDLDLRSTRLIRTMRPLAMSVGMMWQLTVAGKDIYTACAFTVRKGTRMATMQEGQYA